MEGSYRQGVTPVNASALHRRYVEPIANRCAVALLILLAMPLAAEEWPLHFAEYSVEVVKASGLEPEDPHWMHLHRGHHSAAPSDAVQLRVNIFRHSRASGETLSAAQSGIEIRYTVHGVPVSD